MDIRDELERMLANIVAFLPELLGAILILVIGYFVAKLLEKATDALLEKLRFDEALSRGGVNSALERTGTKLDPSSVVARLVFWIVLLVAILMAANVLGLTAVADMFERLVTYIPNVIVAVLILTLGMILGEFVKDLVAASVGSVGGGMVLAKIAKIAILVLAVFMALDQLRIAPDIIDTAFTLLLGAIALAAALAFGLGGREVAGEYLRQWTDKGRQKAQEMKEAAQTRGDMPRPRDERRDPEPRGGVEVRR
ncbi:MAG: mechanosensitive ion channel [Gemmatimonadota bacterium]